jgi:DNA-binding transcriptional LysR family regulator
MEMDKFGSMSVLLEVVAAGSLSAASQKLRMPLATVSRKISELERHLQTQLFIRSRKQLTLTASGDAYVAACRQILEEIEEAERLATGEYSAPKGDLVITAPIVFGRLHLLPIVASFLKAYPDIFIRLVQSDRVISILDEHLDLALRIGDLPDSTLKAIKLGVVRRIACASPGYLATRGVPKTPNDLAAHDLVTFEGLASPDSWAIWGGKTSEAIPVRSRLIVNTAEAAIDAAIAGLGVTRVLSYQVMKAVRSGELTMVLQEFESSSAPVSLIFNGSGRIPLKLRAFIDFATPRLKEALSNASL